MPFRALLPFLHYSLFKERLRRRQCPSGRRREVPAQATVFEKRRLRATSFSATFSGESQGPAAKEQKTKSKMKGRVCETRPFTLDSAIRRTQRVRARFMRCLYCASNLGLDKTTSIQFRWLKDTPPRSTCQPHFQIFFFGSRPIWWR